MSDAWILAGARTPIARFLGQFRDLSAPQLGAVVIRESLLRADIDPADVDEVIMGTVISAGLGQAPARQAALGACLPTSVAALTVNKVCGSGLKAVMLADQSVRLGDAKIIVAGGMESMTRAPHLSRQMRTGQKLGSAELQDALLVDGLWCAFEDCHMGVHADYTAREHGITRDAVDRYALESQRRAARAASNGDFANEIVPVDVPHKKETISVSTDEGPRPDTNLESLSHLQPVFATEGIVTAGNSSMLSDGAAAVIVANRETADRSPAPWKARIVASHTSGVDPQDLFIAPVDAIRGVLEKAQLRLDDIDLLEINEAFAAQMLACISRLKIDTTKVNVNGGAIALGHPLGASGARVLVTLLASLKRRNLKRGLATLCLGGGNAVAMIVEQD